MPRLINWELISQPYNWLIVAAMVSFAVLAVAIISNGGRLPQDDETGGVE
jgi:hypothetical protein